MTWEECIKGLRKQSRKILAYAYGRGRRYDTLLVRFTPRKLAHNLGIRPANAVRSIRLLERRGLWHIEHTEPRKLWTVRLKADVMQCFNGAEVRAAKTDAPINHRRQRINFMIALQCSSATAPAIVAMINDFLSRLHQHASVNIELGDLETKEVIP